MKLTDSPKLAAFLAAERVATLAVPVSGDGVLHAATMHYIHTETPLHFYFLTSSRSEKCRLLSQGPVTAACVIGTTVGVAFTVQMRGAARVAAKDAKPDIMEAYVAKRGSAHAQPEGADSVLIEFIPDWVRFTDLSKGRQTTRLELS